MEELKKFLSTFNCDWSNVQTCFFDTPIFWLDKCINRDDVYFVWWVNWILQRRAKKEDIGNKNYFYIDLDIRKRLINQFNKEKWTTYFSKTYNESFKGTEWILQEHIKEFQSCITDNIMDAYIQNIIERIDTDLTFCDYSYIVNTGNWIHIYYVWDCHKYRFDEYKVGVNLFYEKMDNLLEEWWFIWLDCDPACKDISRLARMPFTYNIKRTKYWLEKKLAIIIRDRWAKFELYNSFSDIFNTSMELQEREREKYYQISRTYNKWLQSDSLYEDIESINVADMVCKYKWLTLKPDWKNFRSPVDWWNIGMFYDKEKNIIINKWTHYLKTELKWFWPFTFVKNEILWWWVHNKTVFEWFKNEYWFLNDVKYEVLKEDVKEDFLKEDTWYVTRWDWEVDEFLEPMFWKELAIFYGAAWTWKTTYAMYFAKMNWLMWNRVCYVTMELTVTDLFQRAACSRAWITKTMRANKSYSTNQWDIANKYIQTLKNNENVKFFYLQDPKLSQIIQFIKDNKSNFDIFILDNLWKIWWDNWEDELKLQMEVTSQLQSLKNDIGKFIMIIHHESKMTYNPTFKWDTMRWNQKITDNATMKIRIKRNGSTTIIWRYKDTFWEWDQYKWARMDFQKWDFTFAWSDQEVE